MTLTFLVRFSDVSTHWVQVFLYSTRAAMRCALTKHGHDSRQTNACCWQAAQPGKDNCVAEIYLAKDRLFLSEIIHECTHAAYHRTVLQGLLKDSDDFQEYLANATGNLADALIAYLDKEGIQITYNSVPTRTVNQPTLKS